MRLVDRILDKLGIQPPERKLCGWATLLLLLTGAAALGLLNTAESLFLKRVGVDTLPLTLLVTSAILVGTTALAGRVARYDPAGVLWRILMCLGLLPIPFVFLTTSESPWVLSAFIVVSRQVFAIGLLAFWMAMGTLVPTRRAKRLFAPLGAGVTVGAIVGSFGSDGLARVLGVDGLIGLCSALLLAAAFTGWKLGRSGTRPLERAVGVVTARPAASEAIGFIGLLRSNALFRHLGIALLCGGMLSQFLYFEFSVLLDESTQGPGGEERLLGLYSQVRGWMNVTLLVFQVGISSMLYRHLGLPLSVALWPLSYVLGFGWLGMDFVLVAGLASFSATRVVEDGISDSAMRILYNLFPEGIRARVAGWLEGPVVRLGGVVGNSFVLGAVALGAVFAVGWVALVIGGAWLVSAFRLWRTYPQLLLRAASEHGLQGANVDRATLVDGATLHALAKSLAEENPNICRAALDLIVAGEPQDVVSVLAGAIERAPETNRSMIVGRLHQLVESSPPEDLVSTEALGFLAAALQAKLGLSAEDRGDLLRVYARLSGSGAVPDATLRASRALLSHSLGDRAAPVRLAAVAELHRRGFPPPGLPDLDRALSDALEAPDAGVRRAARRELRTMLLTGEPDEQALRRLAILAEHIDRRADRAETAEALADIARRHGSFAHDVAERALDHLADRDPRVRGALLRLIGFAGVAEAAPRLVAALGASSIEESQGAHAGLVALGVEAALPLLVGLEFGGPARQEAVLAVLRELEVDDHTLAQLQQQQLTSIREAVSHRAALEGGEGSAITLLSRRLEERLAEGLGALLALIAAAHDDPRLAEVERQLRRARPGPARDVLIEALETMLGREDRAAILPLVELGDWATAGATATKMLDRPALSEAETLARLVESPDEATRWLASAVPLDVSGEIGDAGDMPPVLDLAARLQSMPAFDRLSVEQCLALASSLQEQKLGAGERLYVEGEEGTALYFVLEGRVELRRGALLLAEIDAGGYLGELSALDGVPRSADAVASVETRLLRLDQEDLLAMVEQAPSLAIALAQRLSARVRRLEDQLELATGGPDHEQ